MKKIYYIDALRGLAILAVIMVHAAVNNDIPLPLILLNITTNGDTGVQLFFLASAFTLFLSYNRRLESERFPIRNFFLRRFFRIAPMYYIGIIYYLFQNGLGPNYWLGDHTHISLLNILSNFTFSHGFNPYWINSLVPGGWSIAVEMTFYAILPILFLKIKNINHALNFLIFSVVSSFLLNLILHHYPLISCERLWGQYLFFYFPNQLPIFALGILMYYILYKNNNDTSMISGKTLLILSLCLFIQLVMNREDIFQRHLQFGICFLFLGIGLSRYNLVFFVNPVINYIGKISFSMYLVHFAVIYWLTKFNLINYFQHATLNYITNFSIITTVTVLISSVFYKLVEVPFQNIGKNIIERLEDVKN